MSLLIRTEETFRGIGPNRKAYDFILTSGVIKIRFHMHQYIINI